jgi:hypothetical protein
LFYKLTTGQACSNRNPETDAKSIKDYSGEESGKRIHENNPGKKSG